MIRTMAFLLGLPALSTNQALVALALFCLAALALGWLADLLLGHGALGVIGNALVMLLGAALGLWAWRKLGIALAYDANAVTASVALAAALASLLMASALRRYV
ncbi:hypothetical protein ASG72_12505 [Bosea sp. Leaf344]|uniref:hypothetical protein n=1 Tax=Bosea sp. Leaf344 TaxID=1736346 RepID=UPI0006F944D4|nr:hypothetical protein [Bosea sp. Leaf344]KQU50680.1 hypothetical protein ASG72_12505 [Bosea sp. Leaf344]